jgi:2-polyprenyl-3-methyl-5-hydroxy-6-metoxy-1,4-benzoquinol methylase
MNFYVTGSNSLESQYCPLCQSSLRGKPGAKFLSCNNCGLMIRRGESEVEGLYRSGWRTPIENLNLTGGTTPELGCNYTSELVRTLGLKNLVGKNILDFGGGRGEMALALQAAGARVVTVDPYSHVQLKEKGLLAVASLEQLSGGESFDGAVAIDVIEHLTSPWQELEMIRRLLRSDGWLYLSTPNGWGLNARVKRANWRETLNPSHLLLFTPPSVERTLMEAGFARCQRLRWRVDYSDNRLVQAKDWLLRLVWWDGVLRYLAYA